MLAAVIAVFLQQAAPAATGQVVWAPPPPPEPLAVADAAPLPPIPDSARADPYGYERAQCSPLIRSAEESLEACQARVRGVLAAHLGHALPAGLTAGADAETCRREAAGDRYAVQCGAPSRSGQATAALEERICETRPQAQEGGGVVWQEECRPASRRGERDEGLTLRWGDRD